MAEKEKNMDEILVCVNRKARFNYFLSEFTEAGIELVGTEIKSLRSAHCSLDDSYVIIKKREAYVLNMNIPVYQANGNFNHEPTRTRKLLLHKRQIDFFEKKIAQDGFTVVPVRVYIKHGKCKVQIALAKGKKNYDKRETIKEREDQRMMSKALKRSY